MYNYYRSAKRGHLWGLGAGDGGGGGERVYLGGVGSVANGGL